jgi:hypothetical protein
MKKVFFIFVALFCTTEHYAQVCLWNMQRLADAKKSHSQEARVLVRFADDSYKKDLVYVTAKEMTPPSGDKHDYMSMGRYWWPDSTKTDGLPYIRKDGQSNPEIEKLDRYPLSKFAKSIETLALGFYMTDDEKYAKKAVANLRAWFVDPETKMNPNMNYGQTIPGLHDGMGRGEGILDTYSFVHMLDAVEVLKGSKTFTAKDQHDVKMWFDTYLKWLETATVASEEQQAKNNHGTAYDVQVARFALFVGDQELIRTIVDQFPADRLYTQILADGSQPLEL